MSIKHKSAVFSVLIITLVLSCIAPIHAGLAGSITEEPKTPWGIGLRFGPSITTQDLNSEGVTSSTGVSMDLEGSYKITDLVSAGLIFNWENHGSDYEGTDQGSMNTFSFLPFAQYRFFTLNRFSLYGRLAAGFNINTFDVSDVFPGKTITLGNTFSIRPSVGLDYFVLPSLALNTELGWKWNAGSYSSNVTGVNGDFNASAVHLLFGARYYF